MNQYERLEVAIDHILQTNLTDKEGFFKDDMVIKLQSVRELMYFPEIDNAGFRYYLDLFINDIQVDIERCLTISPVAPVEEKEQLLELIKMHVEPKLNVVGYAFRYYLNDNSELFNKKGQKRSVRVAALQNEDYASLTQ